jgi:hypothetical protein
MYQLRVLRESMSEWLREIIGSIVPTRAGLRRMGTEGGADILALLVRGRTGFSFRVPLGVSVFFVDGGFRRGFLGGHGVVFPRPAQAVLRRLSRPEYLPSLAVSRRK